MSRHVKKVTIFDFSKWNSIHISYNFEFALNPIVQMADRKIHQSNELVVEANLLWFHLMQKKQYCESKYRKNLLKSDGINLLKVIFAALYSSEGFLIREEFFGLSLFFQTIVLRWCHQEWTAEMILTRFRKRIFEEGRQKTDYLMN